MKWMHVSVFVMTLSLVACESGPESQRQTDAITGSTAERAQPDRSGTSPARIAESTENQSRTIKELIQQMARRGD